MLPVQTASMLALRTSTLSVAPRSQIAGSGLSTYSRLPALGLYVLGPPKNQKTFETSFGCLIIFFLLYWALHSPGKMSAISFINIIIY